MGLAPQETLLFRRSSEQILEIRFPAHKYPVTMPMPVLLFDILSAKFQIDGFKFRLRFRQIGSGYNPRSPMHFVFRKFMYT